MRIGEVASAAGLSVAAIRFYESNGLLPAPRRHANGYRDYSADVLDRLAFVRRARAAGLTLRETADILRIRDGGRAPCDHVTATLGRRLDEVRDHIRALTQLESALTELHAEGQASDPLDCPAGDVCRLL